MSSAQSDPTTTTVPMYTIIFWIWCCGNSFDRIFGPWYCTRHVLAATGRTNNTSTSHHRLQKLLYYDWKAVVPLGLLDHDVTMIKKHQVNPSSHLSNGGTFQPIIATVLGMGTSEQYSIFTRNNLMSLFVLLNTSKYCSHIRNR